MTKEGKKNMNKIRTIMAMLIVLLVANIMTFPVSAYDANSPYTVTVNYIVPNDTTFTVTLAGAESSIDFNPGNRNSTNVEPDSQNAGGSTPIATIVNTGNIPQTFGVNITSAQYAWVAVTLSNSNDYSNPITLSATKQTPTGWSSISAAASIDAYMKADFTDAPGGTLSKTMEINSSVS